MVYNNPQPDPGELIGIYKEVEDPLYEEESQARERTFRRSLGQLHRIVVPPGKLLDIGCYTGVFMKVAAEGGWEVEGVELSAWAAGIARSGGSGKVYEKPLDELTLPAESFDAIALWDVIEHLTQPAGMLKSVHRLLKPGGVIAFSTHMVDSLAVRLMGARYPFFMDMHVVHFSRRTIRKLLEQEGYELIAIRPHRRILRLGYFIEKLKHKITFAPFRIVLNALSKRRWITGRFIGIGLLGLVNIFARKA
jgi:2-polyprenyl-3-methyl-5-hydroxy-6-metoxy-1,4-benzoquinol methylase